ncbi:MAG TPA: acyl-ACP--UDP-N-acetylglucosamine O-acyltransferase [Chthoniobacterales bacterium]|jgi:UDP-N-acetylglucosamine acyltransferase|nr:acyl-ACP--UDP-N-acetylglucosamine O-acyltransferase [Chthoniobacterales bacterium]
MIHSTAIIDSSAGIGSGTEVGPYTVIGPGVVIGENCVIHNHVSIAGPTRIGDGNTFFPYCSVGQRTQDLKYAGEPTYLEIGNQNSFREFCTINRGTAPESKTIIGSHGNFLAYSHIAHDCTVGDHVIFSNNGTLAGHVIVEDHAVIGGLAGVHQFCRIGQHAITGGCTKIVQDVPPFMIADGNPAEIRGINQVGLERRGFDSEVVRSLREAYKLIYRANLNTKQAVAAIREQIPANPQITALIDFIETSKRGIVH